MTLPDWLRNNTLIYHITALENLDSIFQYGCIFATNLRPCNHLGIANGDIQARRAIKTVPVGPGGVLHDYVPFYFAPRSPMLYANYVRSFSDAKSQDEIIYLVSSAHSIHQSALPYVFYDRNATLAHALAYDNISDINMIDWELFFERPLTAGYSTFWQSRHDPNRPKWVKRQEVRQAEFLVHQNLPCQFINRIATMNETRTKQAQSILDARGVDLQVETLADWYF